MQQKLDVESEISEILIRVINMYNVSGRQIASLLGVEEATVSRLKNRTQKSSEQMLSSVRMMETIIKSELQVEAENDARAIGITFDDFVLCCLARSKDRVVKELDDPAKFSSAEKRLDSFLTEAKAALGIGPKSAPSPQGAVQIKNTPRPSLGTRRRPDSRSASSKGPQQ